MSLAFLSWYRVPIGIVLTVVAHAASASGAWAESRPSVSAAASTRCPPPLAADADTQDVMFHPIGMMVAASFYFYPQTQPPRSTTSVPTDPGDPGSPNDPGTPPNPPPVYQMPPAPQPPPTSTTTHPPTDGGGGTKPPPVAHAPEPATFVSGFLGAGLVGWMQWRRRRQSS